MGSFRKFLRRVAAKMAPDTIPDSRPLARRQPLGDVTAAANNAATPIAAPTASTTSTTTPAVAVAAAIAAFRSAPPAAAPQGKKKPATTTSPTTNATTTATTNAPTAPATTTPPTSTSRASRTLRTLSGALLFRRKKTSVGPWKLGRSLGAGANGKVKEARHVVTGEMAAVKIVRKEKAREGMGESEGEDGKGWEIPVNVEREVAVMAVLSGMGDGEGEGMGMGRRNLVGLKDVFENGREVYLILDHVPHGDLHTYITSHGRLPESHAMALLAQLLHALTHLHSLSLTHRDLKPENILLSFHPNSTTTTTTTPTPTLLLADFGLAALFPPSTLLTTPCGSPHYIAPEIALGRPYSGPLVDAWACGVILYAMLTGTLPFPGRGTQRTLASIAEGKGCPALPRGVDVSREGREVLRGLLCRDPRRRMSVREAGGHAGVRRYAGVDADAMGATRTRTRTRDGGRGEGRRALTRAEIDGGVVRGLGSIWHWVGEEELVARLVSDDGANQEKRFYEAMCRFRATADERYLVEG